MKIGTKSLLFGIHQVFCHPFKGMQYMMVDQVTNPPESAYGLWYDVALNRFCDEDGNIIHDLHELFPVWQLDAWKHTQSYGVIMNRKGELCELYWCDDQTNEYGCEHSCLVCNHRCEIYDLVKDW